MTGSAIRSLVLNAGLSACLALLGPCASAIAGDLKSDPASADEIRRSVDGLLTEPIDTWSPVEVQAASFTGTLTGLALGLKDDSSLADTERSNAFRRLVADLFDVRAIGRMLLGDNKDRLDDHQLANYSQVVADYLVPIYAAKLGDVCNTPPAVVSVHKQNGAVFVRTEFTARVGAPPTYVDWLVSEQHDGTWRALDIAIDGVSVAQAKQDEFSSVIANRGPDAFIELLYRQAGDALPEPLAASVVPEDSMLQQTASKTAE